MSAGPKEVTCAPLVVVSGPSGVGKSTVVDAVLLLEPRVWLSVSVTTRLPRSGEREGVNYFFVDDLQFDAMLRTDDLLEWAEFAGHRYGTPRGAVAQHRDAGIPVILEIEVSGARQVRDRVPEAHLVFLAPPSWEELIARLLRRGTESAEAVGRRLEAAKTEMQAMSEFDQVLVNADIGESAAALVACLHDQPATRRHHTPFDRRAPGED